MFNRSGPRRKKYAPPKKKRVKKTQSAPGPVPAPPPVPKLKPKPKPKPKPKLPIYADKPKKPWMPRIKVDPKDRLSPEEAAKARGDKPKTKPKKSKLQEQLDAALKAKRERTDQEKSAKKDRAPTKPKKKDPRPTRPPARDAKKATRRAKPVPKPIPKPKTAPAPKTAPDGLLERLAKVRGDESNLSELDKLKSKFEMLTNQRFIRDPGPEHHQAIKDLGDQIYALDKNFESPYYTRTAPTAPTPTRPDLPEGVAPGGRYYNDPVTGDPMYAPPMPKYGEGMSGAQVMPTPINLNTGKPNPPSFPVEESVKEESIEIGPPPGAITPQPAPPPITPEPSIPDSGPPVEVQPIPEPTPPPSAPPAPPPLVKVDPFKGFSPSYRPENIVGQSFDPSVREDYEKQMQEARARMMQPGGNIAQNPTYQTPTMAVPQTQFGGYGQPMPIAPLLPYSGLAAPKPPKPDFDV